MTHPLTWLCLYALVGSLVGLSLAWQKGFTRINQVVGALIWPITLATFFWGFLKAFCGNEDEP